jgi:TolA-binding protein
MATYNKRGHKVPKPKDIEDINDTNEVDVNAKDSTTAEVFSALDESASRTEEWVARNQKYIFSIVGAIAFLTVAYLTYDKFVLEPKEEEAAEEMFTAQKNFQAAVDATNAQDSLFNLALNGAESKYGFLQIIDKYSGTEAANLAYYFAGISFLNTEKYTEAIAHLDQFTSEDVVMSTLATGAIGDAFAQKNQLKEALEYYTRASQMNANEMTTPRFLLKAGQTAYMLDQKAEALKFFTELKEKYETAPEARNVEGLIGMMQ